MRFPLIILLNVALLVGLGYYEFKFGRTERLLPLVFVLFGIVTLSMNNSITAGSKSVAKVVLTINIISILVLIEPIHFSYIRSQMDSVYRYIIIGITNIITIGLLAEFLLIKKSQPPKS